MLGSYERRHFLDGEKIWLGKYRNLANVLHWHFACEIIRIAEGAAKIRIGEHTFDAVPGDCFFCGGEQLHYILSCGETQIDIAIFSEDLMSQITDAYTLVSPKLPKDIPVEEIFEALRSDHAAKGAFYREAMENRARGLLIDIFRQCERAERKEKGSFLKEFIAKIDEEFAYITFDDAVRYSGYTPSHFSKLFKKLTGMSFSQYRNIIRVENAIVMLREDRATTTSVSRKCGFSTIRNFNRVFKKITGYAPHALPRDFVLEADRHFSSPEAFDPTEKTSVLI